MSEHVALRVPCNVLQARFVGAWEPSAHPASLFPSCKLELTTDKCWRPTHSTPHFCPPLPRRCVPHRHGA
jgi:hypothetical protein